MVEQRTRAEQALTDLLFDRAGVGLCLVAPDGTVVRANAEWLRSTGFTSPEVVGEDLVALFPDARDMVSAVHARARAGETVAVPPHQVLIQGRPTWWEGSVSPVPMDGGVGLLITARDVTEQLEREASNVNARDLARVDLEHAERQLRARETQLRLALEASRIGTWTWDIGTDAVTWSPESYAICGIAAGAFEGTGAAFFRMVHPADVARLDTTLRAALGGREQFRCEFRIVRPDGTEVWVENLGMAVYGPTGQPERVLGTVADITARKRAADALGASERRFRALADAMPQLVWIADADGLIRYFNARLEQYGEPGHLPGGRSTWQPLIHPDDLARTEDAWRRAAAERRAYACEHRVRMADGTFRWHVTRANPVEEDGPPTWYGTTTDIHERVEAHRMAELEREHHVAELEARVGLSDLFVGILGHDLRDPLSAISLGAKALHREPESPQIRATAQRIGASADRMQRMIAQLLDVTRARIGGGLSPDPRSVDLGELLQNVVDEVGVAHHRTVDLQVEGNARGTWDASLLEQLVANLVSNACHHGTADAPVRVRLDGANAELVRLEVRNAGAIPPDVMPVIFDPFRRGRRGLRRAGLGLGLFIAREIALAHGGTIRVESSLESGTRFFVELPRTVSLPGHAFAVGVTPGDTGGPAGQPST